MLSKIEELRYIAESTNTAVIGINESKLDISVLEKEISIDKLNFCVVTETCIEEV